MSTLVALHAPAAGLLDAGDGPAPPVDVVDAGAAGSPTDGLSAVGPFDPSDLTLAAATDGQQLVALEG
jgi:hypothetical protein